MAHQFCKPVFDWWLRIEISKGNLPQELLSTPVKWVGSEFPTLDARAQINSTVAKIRGGLLSRSEAVASMGIDPIALDEQISSDNKRADLLGLVFDSDARRVSSLGQEQPTQPNEAGNATIQ
jgi:capsid protein